MTHKMANIIYRNSKLGNITLDKRVINRIYIEADSCMYYANLYTGELKLQENRQIESKIIENLINGNYNQAQSLLNEYYAWVLK